MSNVTVSVSAAVDAPAHVVYHILADYDHHHRRILPTQYFTDLDIEEGGAGAGTRLIVTMKVMGRQQQFHLIVTEPEPGVVLSEAEINTDMVTTFTVRPMGDSRSEVTIQTVWQTPPGLAGVADRLVTPLVTRHIYRQELRQLNEYARQQAEQSKVGA